MSFAMFQIKLLTRKLLLLTVLSCGIHRIIAQDDFGSGEIPPDVDPIFIDDLDSSMVEDPHAHHHHHHHHHHVKSGPEETSLPEPIPNLPESIPILPESLPLPEEPGTVVTAAKEDSSSSEEDFSVEVDANDSSLIGIFLNKTDILSIPDILPGNSFLNVRKISKGYLLSISKFYRNVRIKIILKGDTLKIINGIWYW